MAEEKEESQIKIDDWEPNTVITPETGDVLYVMGI